MSGIALGHLDEAQRALLHHAQQVARSRLTPLVAAGVPHHVNRELVRELAATGLLKAAIGSGRAVDLCLIREGLAQHCVEAETALAVQGLGAHPIAVAAQPEVRDAWMPRILRGEAVGAFALTEPAAGSDAAALQLAAQPDGAGYRLHGDKAFISNAPDADVYTVFARTGAERTAGVTAFVVPGDAPGLSGERTPMVSGHPIGALHFESVFVDASHVLGEVGAGFAIAMRTLDLFRPSVGACGVGIAQAALDAAVRHAAERSAFGTTLSRLQGVSHQLADIATQVHAARLLVHAAASAYDRAEQSVTQLSAMAKLFATETAQRAVDVAIQVHGARALREGHPLEHLYRDVRGIRIYEGASEVQREVIARSLFRAVADEARGPVFP